MTNTNTQNRVVTNVAIGGMSCGNCSGKIESLLVKKPGVYSAKVDLANKQGVFEHDAAIITSALIIETIEDMGFDAEMIAA